MSNKNELAAPQKNAVEQKTKQPTIRDLLEKMKGEISRALPQHLTADRMTRVALTTINKNPNLGKCTQTSLLSCIMDCASLGLEPDNVMGRAYLIPYKDTCTLIIGYKGLLELAYRSGQVESLDAFIVHSNDTFKLTLGLSPNIVHEPCLTDPGEMVGVYAVAKLKGLSLPKFAYMTKAEVDSIRGRSRAGQSGPWVTDYNEMAKKTAVRRLCKMLPLSAEFADALVKADENEFVARPVRDVSMPKEKESPKLFAPPVEEKTVEQAPEQPAEEPAAKAPAKEAPAQEPVEEKPVVGGIPVIRAALHEAKQAEGKAVTFLQSLGYLDDGQTLDDLDAEGVASVTKNLPGFCKQVAKFVI